MKNTSSKKQKILIFNASPQGPKGNCAIVISRLQKIFSSKKSPPPTTLMNLSEIDWKNSKQRKTLFSLLKNQTAFIFVTGTYWDSWGSPLQSFLENITELEGSTTFLGKPAAVIVLNHSVGGKSVLSRLQGVLSTLGCLIPPMSGTVYAWTTEHLIKEKKQPAAKDLWQLDDLETIAENLMIATEHRFGWATWPVDRKDFKKIWINSENG